MSINNSADQQAKNLILVIISGLLILLFVYTAGSKWLDFQDFKRQMYGQVFSRAIATILIQTLPPLEILTAFFLLVPRFRWFGLLLASLLMIIFTAYMGLIYFGYYQYRPCSCGGVLKSMSFGTHFYFNLSFLLFSLIGLYLQYQLKKGGKHQH